MPRPTEHSTAGRGNWRRRALRSAALGAIALVGTGAAVALADTAGSGSTDTTASTDASTATEASTATAPVLAPAPAGFAQSLISDYTDQYTAATELASVSSATSSAELLAPSTFTDSVDALTPEELAQLYAASQQDPNWDKLPSTLSTLDAQAKRYAASPVVRSALARATRGTASHRERSHREVSHAAATERARRSVIRARVSARATSRAAAAEQARDGLLGAAESFPPTGPTTTIPTPPSLFTPSSAVGPSQTVACPQGAPGGPSVAPGDASIFAAQLSADISADLADDVPDTLEIAGESYPDPAKYIAEVAVIASDTALDTLNYYQGVANDCDTGNQDAILANLDNTTQQTYALESEYIQPTVDAIESGLATIHDQVQTVQNSVDEQLTIDIEEGLSASTASGAAPPNIEFMLPAADGGNLDSTPVGVESVVTNAISQAKAAGLVINAMITRDVAAANQALAAGQYRTAYDDYQAAYQGLG